MTVLVALQADDGVWIGADTARYAGEQRIIEPSVKWENAGPWWVAIPGAAILTSLFAEKLRTAVQTEPFDRLCMAWLSCQEVYKSCNDRIGIKHDGDNAPLIAHATLGVIHLDPHGYITRHTDPPWYAMGSGGSEARGALHALWGRKFAIPIPSGGGFVECALEAACALDAYCHGAWIKRLEP